MSVFRGETTDGKALRKLNTAVGACGERQRLFMLRRRDGLNSPGKERRSPRHRHQLDGGCTLYSLKESDTAEGGEMSDSHAGAAPADSL